MNSFDFVLWDWNGTLLDDLEMNLQIVDVLLSNHKIENGVSREFYLENFAFPISRFYEKIGFDLSKHDFMALADEYDEEYLSRLPETTLFKNAESTLAALSSGKVHQAVISATEHERLVSQVKSYGIEKYFDAVLGTENHLGKGKVAVAEEWLKQSGANPERTVFIGDTLHDFECSKAIGCTCFLIAGGHNSKEKLLKTGCEVFDDIGEIKERVLEKGEEKN